MRQWKYAQGVTVTPSRNCSCCWKAKTRFLVLCIHANRRTWWNYMALCSTYASAPENWYHVCSFNMRWKFQICNLNNLPFCYIRNSYSRWFMARDISVGIATRYGMDVPGIESRLGARFSVHTGPVSYPASYTTRTGPFPGVKQPGVALTIYHASNAEVKDGLESYFYSLSLGLRGLCQGELYVTLFAI
jgi:hypothetical protein